MKILHVANFSNLDHRTFHYSCDRKFNTAFIRNGHCVFEFSHRDIARANGLFQHKYWGVPKMNTLLLERINDFRPDLLLLGHGELVTIETIQKIKNKHPSLPIAMWYVDWLKEKESSYLQERIPLLDVLFCADSGEHLEALKKPNVKLCYIPNPADSSIETGRAFELPDLNTDFVFCGRDHKAPQRGSMMRFLFTKLPDLNFSIHGCLEHPPIFGTDYIDLLSHSKMGLNLSRWNDVRLATSDRLVHLTGNGVLTFSPRVPGLEMLYKDNELVYFNSQEDLVEKIRYYHENGIERNRIAEAGWQRTHHSYSAQRITTFMLETIFDQPYSEEYEWKSERY